MRVQISNPSQLDALIAALRSEPDAVVEPIRANELEVSLLGSYADDAMRMELYLRLRAWEATPHDAAVEAEILN